MRNETGNTRGNYYSNDHFDGRILHRNCRKSPPVIWKQHRPHPFNWYCHEKKTVSSDLGNDFVIRISYECWHNRHRSSIETTALNKNWASIQTWRECRKRLRSSMKQKVEFQTGDVAVSVSLFCTQSANKPQFTTILPFFECAPHSNMELSIALTSKASTRRRTDPYLAGQS